MNVSIIVLVILLYFILKNEKKIEKYTNRESLNNIASVFNKNKLVINSMTVKNDLNLYGKSIVKSKINVGNNVTIKKNLNVEGDLSVNGKKTDMPSKLIMLWAHNSPPDGWVLCDGNNNTPKLNDGGTHRYIMRK